MSDSAALSDLNDVRRSLEAIIAHLRTKEGNQQLEEEPIASLKHLLVCTTKKT